MRKTKSLVTYNLISWGTFIKWFLIWLIGFDLLFVVIGLFTHGFRLLQPLLTPSLHSIPNLRWQFTVAFHVEQCGKRTWRHWRF